MQLQLQLHVDVPVGAERHVGHGCGLCERRRQGDATDGHRQRLAAAADGDEAGAVCAEATKQPSVVLTATEMAAGRTESHKAWRSETGRLGMGGAQVVRLMRVDNRRRLAAARERLAQDLC